MEERYTEAPDIITSVDEKQAKLNIEIALVNAEKENINLMVNDDGCYLSVPTEDVEYVATIAFLRPVNPTGAKAAFTDGFLRIEVPFRDPLENYVKVVVATEE